MALDLIDIPKQEAMSPVNLSDQALDSFFSVALAWIREQGFDMDIDTNMRNWASFVENALANDGANPAFNPDASGPHHDAFWVNLTFGGRTVATMAQRRIDCEEGYYEFLRSGRLWGNRINPIDILIRHPGVQGRVGHSGGLYVHPDFRRLGLSWYLPRVVQARAILEWGLSFIGSTHFEVLSKVGIVKNYGFQSKQLIVDGYFWPTGKNERIYAADFPASFIVERAVKDLASIAKNSNKQVRDLAPVVRKRKAETAVG